ncbi:MAG: HIRAN domain-containing protein [Betaproteobacteria bacterium]|uniref:HIRAN domain-containing protein n=1 Tax=Candidatus Proximibacter danicus TaxID=2954365 RepID=A0A9D7K4J6_9PROT|nr:HIRAN domain-containing protein [Candidatus Proximibacter danicus]
MPFLPTTFSTSQPRAVFFALLFALLLTCAANAAESVKVLVQSSPLAGSQYYALSSVWPEIRAGDKLLLTREPDNRHDANAIRVEWNGQRLGYVPRSENRALAAAMDRGDTVEARVSKLRQTKNPWQRVEFEVYLVL